MRGISATLAALGLVLCAPVAAQGNDDDYTPLNSRIKRDRQFPTDLAPRFTPGQMSKVNRDRSRAMLGQFSKCLFRRSNEDSLELLEKTDLGFVNFEQVGLTPDKAARNFGFQDCLGHVANMNASGVAMRFWAGNLRSWLLQEAYFKAFAAAPENADFAYNLAVSLDHLRQGPLALDYYRRAIALAERRAASFDLAAARSRAAALRKAGEK